MNDIFSVFYTLFLGKCLKVKRELTKVRDNKLFS